MISVRACRTETYPRVYSVRGVKDALLNSSRSKSMKTVTANKHALAGMVLHACLLVRLN